MSEANKPNDRNLPETSASDSSEFPITPPTDAAVNGLPSSLTTEAQKAQKMAGGQLAATNENDWETVNLPNTIAVDALQKQTVEEAIAGELLLDEGQAPSEGDSWLNSQLLKRVAQLERALQECRSYLQRERRQTEALSSQLEQQTKELKSTTEELEVTRQEFEAGQVAIANLSQNLQFTQERMALMERECALTQKNYQEQSQLKQQLENTCRELRARLHRQQRHTLQFKAALEKCIEKPGSVDLESIPTLEPVSSSPATSPDPTGTNSTGTDYGVIVFSKAQPIQPWSAKTDPDIERLAATTGDSNQETIREIELAQDNYNQLLEITKDTVKDLIDKSPANGELQDVAQEVTTGHSEFSFSSLPKQDYWPREQIRDNTPRQIATGSKERSLLANLASNSAWEDAPEKEINVDKNKSNRPQAVKPPAPLVYPQASAKKRRSLAAVELPSFASPEQ